MQLIQIIIYILISFSICMSNECENINTSEECSLQGYCEWGDEDGGYCDDCAYDGCSKCIRDCIGVCSIDPVIDPLSYCEWFTILMDDNSTEDNLTGCLADCGDDSDSEINNLYITEWVCNQCSNNDDNYCQWIYSSIADPDKRCGGYSSSEECTANTFCAWDNSYEGFCDEANCENGNYDQTQCNAYSQCSWDNYTGECKIEDPYECLYDCLETPPIDPVPNEFCQWLTNADENCSNDCTSLVNVEMAMCQECSQCTYVDNGDAVMSLYNNFVSDDCIISNIFPNPFNPTTIISFSIPEFGLTTITAYDITGRKLEMLINTNLNPGNYSVNWNASSYPSGVYLIRMNSGNFTETQKVVLVK